MTRGMDRRKKPPTPPEQMDVAALAAKVEALTAMVRHSVVVAERDRRARHAATRTMVRWWMVAALGVTAAAAVVAGVAVTAALR